eukprot:883410-Pelagomonas_calceolata.AAC.3
MYENELVDMQAKHYTISTELKVARDVNLASKVAQAISPRKQAQLSSGTQQSCMECPHRTYIINRDYRCHGHASIEDE